MRNLSMTLLGCLLSLSLVQPVVNGMQQPGSLVVEAESLLKEGGELHSKPDLLVLDVRSADAFAKGHIPGSVRVDIAAWKEATKSKLDNTEFWKKTLDSMGVTPSSTLVVVGEPFPEVCRTWWLLKYVGCGDVRVLNGGLAAYERQGGVLNNAPAEAKEGSFTPSFQTERYVSADELYSFAVKSRECQVVDNRSADEFRGLQSRGGRAGHIPDAKNSDWQKYLGSDGKFLPREQLREVLTHDGIDLGKPIATHCQTGGRSSVGALVIEWVSEKPVRNYYRSWSEWSNREDLPVVK